MRPRRPRPASAAGHLAAVAGHLAAAAGLLAAGLGQDLASAQEPAAPAPGPAAPAAIGSLLEAIRAHHDLPALGGAVVRGDGRVALGVTGVRARGHDVPVAEGDRWHLGSCTKAMTATLVALAVADGQLAWTTPLAEVFPDLAPGMDPAWRAVTVEQLLSHRAGAPADLEADGLWAWLWRDEGPRPAQRRRVVEVVTRRPPVHAPGSAFLYSNAGFMLAGAVLEARTGRAWEDLLEARLLSPLGMTASGTGPPGSPWTVDQPRGHALRPGRGLVPVEPLPRGAGPPADNPPALGPAGTVHASLADWGRFVALHLRGARGEAVPLLTPDALRALHAPRGDGYALGWGVAERPWANGPALTHSGSNTMWFCTAWLAPGRDLAILVTTNCGHDAARRACDEAASALLGWALDGER